MFLYRPALRNIILFIQNIYKILEYNDYNLDTVSVSFLVIHSSYEKKKKKSLIIQKNRIPPLARKSLTAVR